MTPDILENPKYPDVDVQLVGEDGNAFAILGICYRAAQQQGVTSEDVRAFMQEAMAGDYDHLLVTCQKWFTVC